MIQLIPAGHEIAEVCFLSNPELFLVISNNTYCIVQPHPLFTKIEEATIHELKQKFGGTQKVQS